MMISIEVVYGLQDRQALQSLEVPAGSTVQQAIELSKIRQHFPEIPSTPLVGIFSQKISLDTPLRDGDRIEIYRPLIIDPKEARRRRAKQDA